ncbi:hypothetical protein AO724_19945 [Aeromonas allosaccharophila]|nr:hypothetical protein AO724_19945 [Aeromonas allosaccharophila]
MIAGVVAKSWMHSKIPSCYVESHCIYSREMPTECLEEIRLRTQVSRPTQYDSFSQNEVQQHFDASGKQSRVKSQFDNVGAKWLVREYARLEVL